jgi:hypothetical protein
VTSATLVAREQAHAWELRTFWATGREVVVVLDPDVAAFPRVRGIVHWVAPTGAAVRIDDGLGGGLAERDVGVLVPCVAILALRSPHFQEDGVAPRRVAPPRVEADPNQLSIFEEVS